MEYNKFISLDISSNTGFAIFCKEPNRGYILDSYGLINAKIVEYKSDIKKYSDFPAVYPLNFLYSSRVLAREIRKQIKEENIEFVVIEHTEKGKQRLSQRMLEWYHYAVCDMLHDCNVPYKYILVSDWRSAVDCYIRCWPEYVAHNKVVKKAKEKAIPTKTGRLIAKIDGRRASKMDQKKLSIVIANNTYGLDINDDNIADAINMGTAAIKNGMC